MDEAKVTTWSINIFKGNWIEITDWETAPVPVLEDSRRWASLFLTDCFNPYKEAELLRQHIFLGLGTSPDKLVTVSEDKRSGARITIYETLQDFMLTHEGVSDVELDVRNHRKVLLKIQSDLLSVLSNKARAVVKRVIDESLDTKVPIESEINSLKLLSASSVLLNSVTYWFDRVNLIWFDNKFYIAFYKTYPGTAVGSFRLGLDWYPQELRVRMGIKR